MTSPLALSRLLRADSPALRKSGGICTRCRGLLRYFVAGAERAGAESLMAFKRFIRGGQKRNGREWLRSPLKGEARAGLAQ